MGCPAAVDSTQGFVNADVFFEKNAAVHLCWGISLDEG